MMNDIPMNCLSKICTISSQLFLSLLSRNILPPLTIYFGEMNYRFSCNFGIVIIRLSFNNLLYFSPNTQANVDFYFDTHLLS